MVPESFEDCIRMIMANNPHLDEAQFRADLADAVARKKARTLCENCGEYIWAVGTAMVG